jgi:hypothetical protein
LRSAGSLEEDVSVGFMFVSGGERPYRLTMRRYSRSGDEEQSTIVVEYLEA